MAETHTDPTSILHSVLKGAPSSPSYQRLVRIDEQWFKPLECTSIVIKLVSFSTKSLKHMYQMRMNAHSDLAMKKKKKSQLASNCCALKNQYLTVPLKKDKVQWRNTKIYLS